MAEPSKEAMAIAESDRRQMAENIDAFAAQAVERERERCLYWARRSPLTQSTVINAIKDGRPKP